MADQKQYSDKAEEVKAITERLEAGIKDIFSSDKYKEYLNTLSKFHDYSYRNCVLIQMQKPDATLVAGFKSWKDNFGRNVMKGETGIKILAYAPYIVTKDEEVLDKETGLPILDANGQPKTKKVKIQIPAYKPIYVFDVSQTEGKELPQLVTDLNGEVEDYDKLLDVLKDVSPVPLKFEEINRSDSHGFYSRADNSITVKAGMSQAQTVKTTIHEIAHAMLHNAENDVEQKDRRTKEVEAESVAYTVCQHFGIDSSDYSFAYVASWSSDKELSELKSSLETIRDTASELITKISEKYLGIEKDNVQEQAAEVAEQTDDKQVNDSKIIGNTPYRFIKNKQYVKVPSADTETVAEFLESKNIKYSGRKIEDSTTFTVSKNDLATLEKYVLELRVVRNVISELQQGSEQTADKQEQFSIYQLKRGDEYHEVRFESFEANKDKNLSMSDYDLVYTGDWNEISGNSIEDKLNQIYDRFNLDIPDDFKGHSLSVSDVIAVGDAAHYVDDMGFTEMPDFFKEKEQTRSNVQKLDETKAPDPVLPVSEQEMPKSKITVSNKGIIGNTAYKDIDNKVYIKMSAEEAINAAEKIEASGAMGYSGRIIGDKATLTINSDDEPLFRALTTTPEEIMRQTKQELIEKIKELRELQKALDSAEFDLKFATRRYVGANSPEQKQSALEEMKQAVRDMDSIQARYDELYPDYTEVSIRFDCLLQADFRKALAKDMPQIIRSTMAVDEMDALAYDLVNSGEFDEQTLTDKTLEIFGGKQSFVIGEHSVTGLKDFSAIEKFAKDYCGHDKPLPQMTSEMSENGVGVAFTFAQVSVAFTTEELSQIVLQRAKDWAKEYQREQLDNIAFALDKNSHNPKNPITEQEFVTYAAEDIVKHKGFDENSPAINNIIENGVMYRLEDIANGKESVNGKSGADLKPLFDSLNRSEAKLQSLVLDVKDKFLDILQNPQRSKDRKQSLSDRIGDVKKKSVQRSESAEKNDKPRGDELS